MKNLCSPPPVLDMCWVIAYAHIDDSVVWTGKQIMFVDNEKLGPVPCLAIGRDTTGKLEDVLILYCSEDWKVLGVAGAESIEAAKSRAERHYQGVGAKWVNTGASLAEAQAWIRENYEHIFCLFCGRSSEDISLLFTSKLGAICNHCIDEYYAQIHFPAEPKNAG